MAAVTPAREVALSLLGECRRRDARVREVLRASGAMSALPTRDRAFAQRLVLGVTACSGALDGIVNAHLKRGGKLEPRLRDALRVCAYELCWLSTPAHVAVDQGVGMVRGIRPQAAGLANAVLRRVASVDVGRRRAAVARACDSSPSMADMPPSIDDLALVAGCPAWILRRVADDRGTDCARSLALAATEPPPIYVAPNLERGMTASVAAALDALAATPVASCANAYQIGQPAALATSGLVEAADVVVADLAAQQVVAACAPPPGTRMLELGQGRATKSLLFENAAIVAGGHVGIVGVDSEAFKVGVAKRRVALAGLADHVTCVAFDGRLLGGDDVPAPLVGSFDMVFVDAPCSGTGTMRRHPEIAWALAPDVLEGANGLPSLQLELLCAAASKVRRGGTLAYATCSLFAIENERVVAAFLGTSTGAAFKLESDFSTAVTPGGSDGHFLARMRRVT